MIAVNREKVHFNYYPDGTSAVRFNFKGETASILWNYENDAETMILFYITQHLRRSGAKTIELYMPYIPNARMDRVKSGEDVFTMKYFATFINSLNFDRVVVRDPHSSVSEALIDRIQVEPVEKYLNFALRSVKNDSLIMFYPDEGSMKRYSGMCVMPYAFGTKQRDWKTGKIVSLEVNNCGIDINGRDILIVDDICSRGGTFLRSAEKLKQLGANHIYLYVTHCENTILEGELLTSGLIDRVFTTESIFTKEHEKICVIRKEDLDV